MKWYWNQFSTKIQHNIKVKNLVFIRIIYFRTSLLLLITMKPLKERIINLDNRDYHIHSLNFSDGLHTISELIQFAWTIWLAEIAITDHSQAVINMFREKNNMFVWSGAYHSTKTFQNIYNNVNVIFWVEWDLLNEDWEVCFDIQWYKPDFIILSAHKLVYRSDPKTITQATIKAIKKYHNNIDFIAHPCNNKDFWEYYNMKELVEIANEYNIPLEFNAKNFVKWKTNLKKLDYLLKNANRIYINSDAHNLYEFKIARQEAIKFLKDNNYL